MRLFRRSFSVIFVLVVSLLATGQLHAQAPKPATGIVPSTQTQPVLMLEGPAGKVHLSLAELEGLGLYEVRTSTFWPEDDGNYAGPLLRSVLTHAGMEEAPAIRVHARDGFSQLIPREDWEKWPVLLATRRDGQIMRPRIKGPLRIIYPRDMAPELADSVYRLRWVWLVERIEAKAKR